MSTRRERPPVTSLVCAAALAFAGCTVRQVRVESDAAADAAGGDSAALTDLVEERPAPDGRDADALDARDESPPDATAVLDAEAGPRTDALVPPDDTRDATETAVPADAARDVVDAAAPSPAYRIDLADRTAAEQIGTATLPSPIVSNRHEFACAPGSPLGDNVINGFTAEAPADPSSESYVNRVRFECERLTPAGVVGPPAQLMGGYLNNSSAAVGESIGVQRCPAEFVFVGLQGELTSNPFSGTAFASRIGIVCARVEAWRRYDVPFPEASDAPFANSRPDAPADAGRADAPADAPSDAPAPFGSDALPPLISCAAPRADAPACARQIFGGRPTSPEVSDPMRPQRSFFVTCPGGYAAIGLRAAAGFFVDALQLDCARIIRTP